MIHWISLYNCTTPHRITHEDKLCELANRFVEDGWGVNQEALIGYTDGYKVQLLNGTHRHGAALLAKLNKIPVVLRTKQEVESAVGDLNKWNELMTSEYIWQDVSYNNLGA